MPTVPTFERRVQEQEVQVRGLRADVRTGQEAPQRSTQMLAGIVGDVSSILMNEQRKADNTAITQAHMEAVSEKDRLLHDTKAGFYNKKGKGTLDSHEEFQKAYNEFLNKQQEGVSSRIRDRYDVMRQQMTNQFNSQLDRHTNREMLRYNNEQTRAGLDTLVRTAALNYDDTEASPSSLQLVGESTDTIEPGKPTTINALVNDFAERNGLSPEAKKKMLLDHTSQLHYQVTSRAISEGQDQLAKNYVKDITKTGQLNNETRIRLKSLVDNASVDGDARRQAGLIMDKGLTLGQALEEANKIKDTKVMDETKRRLRNRYAEADLIQQDQYNRKLEDVWTTLEQNRSIDAVQELYGQLSFKDRQAIQKEIRRMNKNGPVEHDDELYYALQLESAHPDTIPKFMSTSLLQYRGRLEKSKYDELVKIQRNLISQQGDMKASKSFRTRTSIVNDSLEIHGIKDKKAKAEFNRALMDQELRWKEENQKDDIPDDVLQTMADRLLTKVDVKGSFFDKRAFELEEGERVEEIDFDDIPRNELRKIRQEFRAQGKPLTEEAAVEIYKLKLSMTGAISKDLLEPRPINTNVSNVNPLLNLSGI